MAVILRRVANTRVKTVFFATDYLLGMSIDNGLSVRATQQGKESSSTKALLRQGWR